LLQPVGKLSSESGDFMSAPAQATVYDLDGRLTKYERSQYTQTLLDEARSARPRRRAELLAHVVKINMEVARGVASRYRRRGIEDEDLDQVAFMALTRAAGEFDPTLHSDFLSYAVPTIRGQLKKQFRDFGWVIRPPRRIQELQSQISQAQDHLSQVLMRSPRTCEIAEYLGADVDDVVGALTAGGCFNPTSLDRPVGQDLTSASTLGDLIGCEDTSQGAVEARVMLVPVVRQLPERDRRILHLRFVEQRTQQEIADTIGVTQMQVSRLLTRILGSLRGELDEVAGQE